MLSFRLGPKDRESLHHLYYPYYQQHFRELDFFQAFVNADEFVFRFQSWRPQKERVCNTEVLNRYDNPQPSAFEGFIRIRFIIGVTLGAIGFVLSSIGFLFPVSALLIPGAAIIIIGVIISPSDESMEEIKQEEQKRLAAIKAFNAKKLAIQQEYELEAYKKSFELPALPPSVLEVDPEIVQIQRQYEIEKLKRKERSRQMSSDIEMLAEKISTTKQFELDALRMVEKLKHSGSLTAEEEAQLKELIKDKVMEEFHVDRRGGRSRRYSE